MKVQTWVVLEAAVAESRECAAAVLETGVIAPWLRSLAIQIDDLEQAAAILRARREWVERCEVTP